MIEVSEDTINRIHEILVGVKDAEKRVLKPAMTRALMAGKTAANKEVRQTYHINAGRFNSSGKLQYNSVTASGEGIIGSFMYSGAVIPLMRYKVTPTVPKQGKTPSAVVLKANSLTAFGDEKNVFVAQMKSGHIGIFERQEGKYAQSRTGKNKHSERLKELHSPSVPKMVENEKVMEIVEDRIQEVVDDRVYREISRILNRYGG